MKAKTFDRKFDAGKKVVDQLDLSNARLQGSTQPTSQCDLPLRVMTTLHLG
jgi:hypothetical protein